MRLPSAPFTIEDMMKKLQEISAQSLNAHASTDSQLKVIQSTLVDDELNVSELRDDVTTLTASHSAMAERISCLESQTNNAKSEVTQLREENSKLREKIVDMSGRLSKVELREKSSEFTISGLSFVNGESANKLALDVCDATETDLLPAGILDAFRFGTSHPNMPAKILVRFASEHFTQRHISEA